jgi:hypothetical protein
MVDVQSMSQDDKGREFYDRQFEKIQDNSDPVYQQLEEFLQSVQGINTELKALASCEERVIDSLRLFFDRFNRLADIYADFRGTEADEIAQSLDVYYSHLLYLEQLQQKGEHELREEIKEGKPARSLDRCLDHLNVLTTAIYTAHRYILDSKEIKRTIKERRTYGL